MTKDEKGFMSALRSVLAGRVGQERFDLWFGTGTRLDYDGTALHLAAPSPFFLEWIRANFRSDIENACRQVLGRCPRLEFRFDAVSRPPTATAANPRVKENGSGPVRRSNGNSRLP